MKQTAFIVALLVLAVLASAKEITLTDPNAAHNLEAVIQAIQAQGGPTLEVNKDSATVHGYINAPLDNSGNVPAGATATITLYETATLPPGHSAYYAVYEGTMTTAGIQAIFLAAPAK